MMFVAVVMSAVVISSCSKDEDDNGGGSIPNNTIVIDGKQYPVQEVEISKSKMDREVTLVNVSNCMVVEIKSKESDGSPAFSSTLTEQKVEIEFGKDDGDGEWEEEGYANVKISYDGGTKYKVLCNNVTIGSHTLSVSFDGDANDFKGSDK